jgi:hypothetical protein
LTLIKPHPYHGGSERRRRHRADTPAPVAEKITMGHPRYTREQIAAHAKAIYEQQIRPRVEPEHTGKYLVINIETGDYELGEDKLSVSERAYARFPGAPLYGMRIGCRSWGQIGSRETTPKP